MSSVSLVDLLIDKLFSYSTKMKGESSKPSGSSYLMSANNFLANCHRPFSVDLMGDALFNSETTNPVISLKQPLGLLYGNYPFNFLNTEKPFCPHLNDLVMDTYRYTHGFNESRISSNSMLVSHIMSSVLLNQSSEMNQSLKSGFDTPKTCIPPLTETKVSTSVLQSHTKSEMNSNKCRIPNTLTLNKELENRKAKEMLKRLKKRRRRQKKNQKFDCSSPASVSEDEVDSGVTSSITSVCLISENTEFGCTVSVSHSMQTVPNVLSPFNVPVDTASSDNSEWESYGVDQCDSSSSHADGKNDSNSLLSSVSISSQVKSEGPDSKCSQPVDCEYLEAASFISSFMVPVGSSSDDESDWDCCETDMFTEAPDFELTGLFITNLCTSQTPFDADYSSIVSSEDEDDETIKIRVLLQEVNKSWNESTKGVEVTPKSPSKVSFAPDEALVEVFPVDVCERKGEWETYANERLRFKRKIDELEKILSPCLNPKHRSKIFKKLNEPTL